MTKEQWARIKNDPKKIEKIRIQRREWAKKNYLAIKADPERYAKFLEYCRKYNQRPYMKKKNASYRKKNKRRHLTYCQEYYYKHLGEMRSRSRKYYHEKVKNNPVAKKKWNECNKRWRLSAAGKAYYRVYREANREKQQAYNKSWRQRHLKVSMSHDIARYAMKKGIIVKKNCSVCGSTKSEMHHQDIKDPLKVIWLCRVHHIEADGRMKRVVARRHKTAAKRGRW